MTPPLPDFKNPPVVEVALAVQFESLAELCAPQLGALWHAKFRTQFPRVEEHAPLAPMMERFDDVGTVGSSVRIEISSQPSLRCWFVQQDNRELIQIQKDRFAHNWRKTGAPDQYPRYEKHLRPKFEEELETFASFVQTENLGELRPNQCEITYVNVLEAGRGWERHGQLARVLSLYSGTFSESFLPEPEMLRISGSFVMPGTDDVPVGRLHFSVEPAFRKSDAVPIFRLTLVARGAPLGDGTAGVLAFMDIGREWIVRGFAALTTERMHEEWERKE